MKTSEQRYVLIDIISLRFHAAVKKLTIILSEPAIGTCGGAANSVT